MAPERQRKGNLLFHELDLRECCGLLRNRELPIDIRKLIGERNLSALSLGTQPSELLDQTLCRLFAKLDKLDEQGKEGNNDVRLLFAPSLCGSDHRLLLRLFFTK